MTVRDILIAPEPELREICAPVDQVDDEVRRLFADMVATMAKADGIGLAACQIGVLKRVIICDMAPGDEEPQILKLVNPEIVEKSDAMEMSHEGCLSIPDIYDDIERHASVTVRYQDEDGVAKEIVAEGLVSFCLQHEIDHLNGVLFIDYLSKLKRDTILRRMRKLKKQSHEAA